MDVPIHGFGGAGILPVGRAWRVKTAIDRLFVRQSLKFRAERRECRGPAQASPSRERGASLSGEKAALPTV